MAENLMVYEPWDKFVTMTADGKAVLWVVGDDGVPVPAWPEREEEQPELEPIR